MMMIVRFAWKNFIGSGLRAWLNVTIIAMVFFVIVLLQGLYDGFQRQVERARILEETGRAQLWYKEFDPLDPLSFDENMGVLTGEEKDFSGTPILYSQGTIYPNFRIRPVIVKGISPRQKVLAFSSKSLETQSQYIAAIIGERMAKTLQLEQGDVFVLRWRTRDGAIDAREIQIVDVFRTDAPGIDNGQIWISIDDMRDLWNAPGYASLYVFAEPLDINPPIDWYHRTEAELLSDTRKMMDAERGSARVLYFILILVAMISLFDTQVLSIFRRRKEVGLLMAMGLSQVQVLTLFVCEGLLQGLLAIIIVLVLGMPFLNWLEANGIHFMDMDQFGLAGSNIIYPYFSFGQLAISSCVFLILSILISYYPARKIARLLPSTALRGVWL
jgi:ABC-type lipoprotein release transport system permease subunit